MSRWFRHYAGMARDAKLVAAALKAGQPVERVLWVWAAILESAAEVNDNGRFELDAAEAAYFLRADADDVSRIVGALEDGGRVSGGHVVKWGDRQFQSDRSADRQQRYRDRQKASRDDENMGGETPRDGGGDAEVTASSRHGDAPETETEEDTKTEGNSLRSFPTRPRPIPPDWKPRDPNANPAEVKRFVAYNVAKGTKMADWDAAWEVWCSRQADYGEATQPKAQGPPPPPQAWVDSDDPRWASLVERSRSETGKPLVARGSKHHPAQGALVPSDWLEPRTH